MKGSKYLIWIFVLVCIINSVSSQTLINNRFIDFSLPYNLTFTGNQNITKFVSLPRYVNVTSSNLTIKGNLSNYFYLQENANQTKAYHDTNPTDNFWYYLGSPGYGERLYDGDYNTGAYSQINGGRLDVNYTLINNADRFNTRWIVKWEDNDVVNTQYGTIQEECWNITGMIRLRLYYANVGGYRLRGQCFNGTTYLNVSGVSGFSPPDTIIYEEALNWSIFNNSINPNLEIGTIDDSYEWNYTGMFNNQNTTNDFSTILNSILPDCSCTNCTIQSDGNCSIPFTFHSDTAGILELSNLNINYTPELNIIIRDELNNSIITSKNINVDIISDSFSYNYTTQTGNDTVNLLYGTYTIRYSGDGYYERFKNYIYDFNSSILTIYLLNSTDAEEVSAIVYNELGNTQEGVLIEYLKYDSSTNSYILMGSGTTNFEGKTNLYLEINKEYYKFNLYYPSTTLKETTSPTYIYSSPITFQINTEDEIGENFFLRSDITNTLIFDNVSNQFNLTYNDPNSIATQYCLEIYKTVDLNFTFVSESCLTTATGTITGSVTSQNDTTYLGKFNIYSDSYWYLIDSLTYEYYFEDNPLRNDLQGLFLILIITLIIIFTAQKYILSLLLSPMPLTIGAIFKIVDIELPYVVGLWLFALIITFMLSRDR